MSLGFQIEVQLDLTDSEWAAAAQHIKANFIDCLKDGMWNHMSRGGHAGIPLGRNLLGYRIRDTDLYFRRISKRRRVFGVVHVNTLVQVGPGPEHIIPGGCTCKRCRGGIRVRWKTCKPETVVVHREGVIKG